MRVNAGLWKTVTHDTRAAIDVVIPRSAARKSDFSVVVYGFFLCESHLCDWHACCIWQRAVIANSALPVRQNSNPRDQYLIGEFGAKTCACHIIRAIVVCLTLTHSWTFASSASSFQIHESKSNDCISFDVFVVKKINRKGEKRFRIKMTSTSNRRMKTRKKQNRSIYLMMQSYSAKKSFYLHSIINQWRSSQMQTKKRWMVCCFFSSFLKRKTQPKRINERWILK